MSVGSNLHPPQVIQRLSNKDGSFSEHLSIGESGQLCVLIHCSTWKTDEPTYELYDAGRHVSCWVHEIPTPERAAKLLEEHEETPEEE